MQVKVFKRSQHTFSCLRQDQELRDIVPSVLKRTLSCMQRTQRYKGYKSNMLVKVLKLDTHTFSCSGLDKIYPLARDLETL